jgi:hypothetical protein
MSSTFIIGSWSTAMHELTRCPRTMPHGSLRTSRASIALRVRARHSGSRLRPLSTGGIQRTHGWRLAEFGAGSRLSSGSRLSWSIASRFSRPAWRGIGPGTTRGGDGRVLPTPPWVASPHDRERPCPWRSRFRQRRVRLDAVPECEAAELHAAADLVLAWLARRPLTVILSPKEAGR